MANAGQNRDYQSNWTENLFNLEVESPEDQIDLVLEQFFNRLSQLNNPEDIQNFEETIKLELEAFEMRFTRTHEQLMHNDLSAKEFVAHHAIVKKGWFSTFCERVDGVPAFQKWRPIIKTWKKFRRNLCVNGYEKEEDMNRVEKRVGKECYGREKDYQEHLAKKLGNN